MMLRRTLVIVTTLLTLMIGAAGPATAAGNSRGVNNYVESDNSNPKRQMAHDNVAVVTDGDGTVDAENIAAARSHDCTGCRTLALAVEVVLVPVTPTTSAPHNAAVAWNERCSYCNTYAGAWQYVVQTGGPTRLTESGMARVDSLADQMQKVLRSGKDFPTIDAQIGQLATQMWAAVNQDLARQGGAPSGREYKDN
jgi:hypothetical protein